MNNLTPTTSEIALLAATLARSEPKPHADLVAAAIGLWHEADRQVVRLSILQSQPDAETAAKWAKDERIRASIPTPARWPVTFEAFERLALPTLEGRTAERAAIFREWAHALLARDGHNPTKAEVAKQYGQFRRKVWTDPAQFQGSALTFLRWLESHRAEKASTAQAERAKKRWQKKKALTRAAR